MNVTRFLDGSSNSFHSGRSRRDCQTLTKIHSEPPNAFCLPVPRYLQTVPQPWQAQWLTIFKCEPYYKECLLLSNGHKPRLPIKPFGWPGHRARDLTLSSPSNTLLPRFYSTAWTLGTCGKIFCSRWDGTKFVPPRSDTKRSSSRVFSFIHLFYLCS